MESSGQRQDWSMASERFATACRRGGIDLAVPFRVAWYNAVVEPQLRLPDFGRPAALAVIAGHTRRVWPRFVAALAAMPRLRESGNPFDDYAQMVVEEGAAAIAADHEIRWANRVGPGMVAMQRAAAAAGLAATSPSYLSVHPTFGPWIGLRALVVFDLDGPPAPAPVPSLPCADCATACMPALARAMAAPADWRQWLAVRDACPVGRQHRYGDEQIEYHYTKNRAVLRRLLAGDDGPAPA